MDYQIQVAYVHNLESKQIQELQFANPKTQMEIW
jgi:hypothetical protein